METRAAPASWFVMDKVFLAIIFASILLLVTTFGLTALKVPRVDAPDRPALMQPGG
jgi:hypothetical protein